MGKISFYLFCGIFLSINYFSVIAQDRQDCQNSKEELFYAYSYLSGTTKSIQFCLKDPYEEDSEKLYEKCYNIDLPTGQYKKIDKSELASTTHDIVKENKKKNTEDFSVSYAGKKIRLCFNLPAKTTGKKDCHEINVGEGLPEDYDVEQNVMISADRKFAAIRFWGTENPQSIGFIYNLTQKKVQYKLYEGELLHGLNLLNFEILENRLLKYFCAAGPACYSQLADLSNGKVLLTLGNKKEKLNTFDVFIIDGKADPQSKTKSTIKIFVSLNSGFALAIDLNQAKLVKEIKLPISGENLEGFAKHLVLSPSLSAMLAVSPQLGEVILFNSHSYQIVSHLKPPRCFFD